MTFVDVGAIRRRTERLTPPRGRSTLRKKRRRERSPLSPFCKCSRDDENFLVAALIC